MAEVNPKKLKVADLKIELEKRNIAIAKGLKKADLVAMLMSAMESETQEKLNFSEVEDPAPESETSQIEDSISKENETEVPVQENANEVKDEPPPENKPNDNAEINAVKPASVSNEVEQKVDKPPVTETEPAVQEESKMETEPAVQEDSKMETEEALPVQEQKTEATPVQVESAPTEKEITTEPVIPQTEASVPSTEPVDSQAESAILMEKELDQNEGVENGDSEQTTETPAVNAEAEADNEESKTESQEASRKRKYDENRQQRWEDRYTPPEEEPADDFDDSLVVLDVYNSDLHFKVFRERTGGQSFTLEGFAYMWAGARATYGAKEGKLCFECKVTEDIPVKHVRPDEANKHVVQVGFSTNKSSLHLGEDEFSYAYCSTGKKATNGIFEDYGETYALGDVVGCYLDFTNEETFSVMFTKNGKKLDIAFTVEKAKLNSEALFPHVLVKNTAIECNFGHQEEPFFPHPEELSDFTYFGSLPVDQRVRGSKAPTSKGDCEVIMMCGLPGSGKTVQCRKIAEEKPEKNYVILGTSTIIDKMKMMGIPRIKSQGCRWDVLINTASNCLSRLLEVACRKRRNYIIDQTNVYASVQRRKMRPFEGFQRRAVVVVPSDEEFKNRCSKRSKDEGKEVPDSAVLEMKANFAIPDVGELFDEILYAELNKEEAAKLLETYKTDSRKNLPPPDKRFRGGGYGNRGWHRGGGMDRGGGMFGGRGGFRGGFGGGPGFGGPGFGGRGGFGGGFGPGGNFGGRGGGNNFRGGRGGGFGNNRGGGFGGNRGGWQNNRGGGGSKNNFQNNRGRNNNRGGNNNRQSQNRGGFQNRNQGQNNQNFRNQNNRQQNSGTFQQNNQRNNSQNFQKTNNFNQQKFTNFGNTQQGGTQQQFQQNTTQKFSQGGQQTNFMQQQTKTQSVGQTPIPQQPQAQVQAYQQSYGQPDYSQQWAQYYQQQAQQNQQFQNYYANYQQYYNQQANANQLQKK